MPRIYAIGRTNDDLAARLAHPDPELRADAARTIGQLHIYAALSALLEVARAETVPHVREAARGAVIELLPDPAAAGRALDGRMPDRWEDRESDAVDAIALFSRYVAARTNHDWSKPFPGPAEGEVREAVFAYLANWIGAQPGEQSEVRAAAERAIGTIARFCEIPPQNAGLKVNAYRDSQARVAEYESVRDAVSS